ncbi:PH domain-containing protein [Nocardioides pacificus]
MSFPAKLLNEGERVVVSTRTHLKVMLLPTLVALLAVAVAAFVSTLGSGDGGRILHWAVWVLAALVVVWWFLRPLLLWATTSYTFTNRRFIKRAGVVAKSGRTIPLNRISGVDFEIGLIDRLFGCGTLVVSDASEQGRVELNDIPHVEKVQLQVADELHRLSQREDDDGT